MQAGRIPEHREQYRHNFLRYDPTIQVFLHHDKLLGAEQANRDHDFRDGQDYLRRRCAGRSKRRLASPTAAVGPEKTLSRQNFKRKVFSNKLRLVAKEQKQGEAPTLIRMGEKSGSLTPFGSLGDASHGVGSDDSTHRSTAYRRSNSIKLAWRRIFNLFRPRVLPAGGGLCAASRCSRRSKSETAIFGA